jgi:hypothetical protein
MIKGKEKSKIGSARARAASWFRSEKPGVIIALLDPPLCLLFLAIFHLLSPQTDPPLFDSILALEILGICLVAGSVSGLAFTIRPSFLRGGPRIATLGVRAPTLPRRSRSPGILELIAPFLKTSMWESPELAMVMHKSYELMKKHMAFIRTLAWTERYTSTPSNFMMSEAISLILKLLPPVEKHSATCSGCR